MRTAIFIGLLIIGSAIRTESKVQFTDSQSTFYAILTIVFMVMDISEWYIQNNKKDEPY